ncbi:TonB-dependent receptor [Sphingobium sp. BYY-5]|uniref:TonB-dependent receptor n=1 Tax=Sphingobium sp. BYY-5 TaxID=2926400 RepID=UPI001FA6DC8F|nr:TonB-dependent receptor [Sphingobium sp. BYY-5]MCI4588748.1 TonB-dependent receptor [Sphingobium sp. BYY-5]
MKKIAHVTAMLLATSAVTPVMAQTAAAPQESGDVSSADIVVTGLKASLQNSAQIKKNTMEIVDSITADDIGKLPDPNVAETLTRVPGVQAYRFGGEAASPVGNGSGLTIRGLTGQTGSRVDGRAYFTAGSREFNVEGASPGMVAGLDVYKNPSADHIEGAIGGLVNIRTRKPFDFKDMAVSAAVGGRYNGLGKKLTPEYFGMVSKRWDVGDGGELGVLVAGSYSQSFNRGDNTPSVGGTQFRRAIRGDSAEYAANVGTGLNLNSAYVGRSDVTYLADVNPTTVAAADRQNLLSSVGVQNNIAQEDYKRTRKGLSAAVQWAPNPDLQFTVEGNYNDYLYHQNYRFLNAVDSRYAQGLTTEAFTIDEMLANRNANGGSNDLLSGQHITGGTFLNSTFTSTGGDEHRRYKTYVIAGNVKWQATDRLEAKFDFSYVKADQYQDNRSVTLTSAAGLGWNITRDLGTPQNVAISGPDLASPSSWVFNNYANGTNQVWDDSGIAAALDLKYDFENSFLKDIKVGGRYATQKDQYNNYSFAGKNLTTNGAVLAANQSNAIPVTSMTDLVVGSPTNFMNGDAGYRGGYLVFSPDAVLGDNVTGRFPLAGIQSEDALTENILNRRYFSEKTYAGYAVADFGFLDDRIKGNAGVRVVKTDTFVRAMITQPGTANIIPNASSSSYTDVLPSFNLTGYITPDTLVRFGYGKGITRPDLGALNPTLVFDVNSGNGSIGNPNLRPQKADSFDLSLEHYFSPVNYVSAGLFYKKIDGFFSGISSCQTVAGAPTPITNVNCTGNQYFLTQTVNAEKGTAKGVELAAQTFFDYDFMPDFLHHFGVVSSFTYVETKNPLTLNGQRVNTMQPLTSKYAYSVAGLYEDKTISARIVYTWRSKAVLFGVATNPIDGRYIRSFGLLDASLNFKLPHNFSLSLTASNLTNQAADRFVGEPGLATGIERQHFVNGRNFGATLRYSFGS